MLGLNPLSQGFGHILPENFHSAPPSDDQSRGVMDADAVLRMILKPPDNGGIGWFHVTYVHTLSHRLAFDGCQQRPIVKLVGHAIKPGRSHYGHG